MRRFMVRRFMVRRFMVIAVVGMLAACGSSGGGGASSSGAGADYSDAIATKIRSGSAGDVFTKSQADCLAKGMVDVIGVDRLQSAGLTPAKITSSSDTFKAVGEKLSESEANDLVDVIAGGKCFDFVDLVVKSAQSSSGSNAFAKLGATKTRCLFDKLLSGPAFRKAMVDSILGRDSGSSSNAFTKAFGNQSSTFKIFSDCNIRPSELNG